MTAYCYSFVLLFVLLALSACSSKPPGCADPQTLDTLRGLIVEDTRKLAAKEAADDPDGWVGKFLDGLGVQVSGIVSDGYVSEAKKHLCRGTLKLTTITGASLERPVSYSTQGTQDQKGSFMLEVQEFAAFIGPLEGAVLSYYRDNRWSGNWTGTYSCSGVGGATDGPQGPYSMPVTMIVEGIEAKLERTTRGGGIEQLEGRFDWTGLGQPFTLSGEGQNSPDDKWRTSFVGKAEGLKLSAAGAIRIPVNGSDTPDPVVRECKLDLVLTR